MAIIEKEIWIARDGNPYNLWAFKNEPIHFPEYEDYRERPGERAITLDPLLFQDITYETGPKKYKITIEEI